VDGNPPLEVLIGEGKLPERMKLGAEPGMGKRL
jgi:hypothetical protein